MKLGEAKAFLLGMAAGTTYQDEIEAFQTVLAALEQAEKEREWLLNKELRSACSGCLKTWCHEYPAACDYCPSVEERMENIRNEMATHIRAELRRKAEGKDETV